MAEIKTEEKIFGIDLGTTNSCISLVDGGKSRVIPVDGDGIVPSVVSFDGKETIVGRRALNRLIAFPDESVRSVKRLMGGAECIKIGRREYSPEDISAMILKYLCDEARRIEDREVKSVVITVPAYFSDAQRRATIDAGERAGLTVERIINEPTAAALFYDSLKISDEDRRLSTKSKKDGLQHTLVYDLGGGTFDVSVLRIGEIVEVLSSTGDTKLGGDDFDETLLEEMFKNIIERGGPDLRGYRPAVARLRSVAEAAKIALSDRTFVLVEEANIPTPDAVDCTLSLEINRHEFDDLTKHLVDRTLDFVKRAMNEAGLKPDDIDRVILVGGMTRMPIISERLTEAFGCARMPVIDPDRCVAFGAAIQGGIISGEETEQILLDVTSHTLSTASVAFEGLECVPIIPRNTTIPAKRSRMFYTMQRHQKYIRVRVFQGESTDPEKNTLIGHADIQLAKAEANCPIIIEYAYDLNGMIRMTVEQKGYGKKAEIRLDSRNPEGAFSYSEENIMDDDVLTDFQDEFDEEDMIAPVNFVTNRARAQLEKMEDGPERVELEALLSEYERALAEDSDDIDDIEDSLLDMLDSL